MTFKPKSSRLALLAATGLAACTTSLSDMVDGTPETITYSKAIPKVADALNEAEMSSKSVKVVPKIVGLGMASVSGQPAKTLNGRRLLAVKAAKLEALRDLTEQVHGIRVRGNLTISEAIVKDDNLSGKIDGVIRGARTVRITPKGSDIYEVELELSYEMIKTLLRKAEWSF